MNFIFKATLLCRLICLFVILVFATPASAITTKEEEDISKDFLRMALKRYEVIDDPMIADYVDAVGQKVLAAFPTQPFDYHFYVVKEEVYNAFAGPAGHIFIHSGLLASLENESELAGILAHEISHVTCRHLSKMIQKAKTTNLATLAGVAAGIFLGAGGAAAAGSAVVVGSMAAGQSLSLSYSRENELQADQIALEYLPAAGYSGLGLLESLKIIRAKTWYGSDIPTYLMTHPAVEDRIAYIGAHVASHEQDQPPAPPKTDDAFKRMKTRLIAHYGDLETALKQYQTAIAAQPDDFFTQYGYGVLLSRNGDRNSAIKYLQAALAQRPFDPCVIQDLGQVYFLVGKFDNALKLLKTAVSATQFNPETYLFLGRTHSKLGNYADAVAAFETIVVRKPDYALAYYYLGETFGKKGRLGLAHFNLGLYYKKTGEMNTSAFHFRKALKLLSDPKLIHETEKLLGESGGNEKSPEANSDQNAKISW